MDAQKKPRPITQAAEEGDANAQFELGMYYRENQKTYEAMHHLIAAAHGGNPKAQAMITYASNAGIDAAKNHSFRSLSSEAQHAKVQELVTNMITPLLASDGGGIRLVHFVSGEVPQVWLNYTGTCAGCHLGATSTAEMILRHFEAFIDKNVVLYLM